MSLRCYPPSPPNDPLCPVPLSLRGGLLRSVIQGEMEVEALFSLVAAVGLRSGSQRFSSFRGSEASSDGREVVGEAKWLGVPYLKFK